MSEVDELPRFPFETDAALEPPAEWAELRAKCPVTHVQLASGDEAALLKLPENLFKVGTAEIKNWFPVIAAMNAAGRKYHQVDYVPCYRSEAGTGNAMCFAYWQ